MVKRQTYSEQIKSPKWQRKRLEVFNERGFKCEKCGNDEKQLNIHHKEYQKGRLIWEYPNSELLVLCNSCHNAIHSQDNSLHLSPLEELLLSQIRIILSRDDCSGSLLDSLFDNIINMDFGLMFLQDMQTISALGNIEEIFDIVRFRAKFHNLEYETSIEIRSLRKEIENLKILQKDGKNKKSS